MAEIVVGILGPVMQLGGWMWTPVKRGRSYIVHYKRNLHSLGLQVRRLEGMQNANTESVEAAEMRGDRIRPEVQEWLIEAANAMTDVGQLNGEAGVGEKCCVGWCPDLKWRYNLGKKAWNLTATVNKLVEEGARFQSVTLGVHRAPEVQNLIPTEGFQPFAATREAMDQVLEALKKEEITVIGVYGMGGIGKTTLVKQVGAQVCRDGLFDSMTMGVFSQNPVVMQIQDQLANMLNLELHETTEILRAARLRERMLRGKKILVILDDIWQTIDLSSIGIPSYEELARCDSKVILTTRKSNVCHAMGSQEKIPLNLLSEDDSWTLFVTNARKSFESTNLCKVAKQVANECGGLPVALITVAKALGDKDQLEEWQEAARRLKNSLPASCDDDERVLTCIRLSYDNLKGEDAKSCFLLCCLFPEDYDIPINDLIKYGLGKGLFRDDGATLEEARSRARSVINYLKSSNLLMEGEDSNYVRMHDVIRDMALLIAASEYGDGFLVKAGTKLMVWPSNAYEGHSAISLMMNDIQKLPQELVCPKLQILLLQHNPDIKEIPETFFESFVELKVLDLSNIDVSTLPHSLSMLTNLQALYLDQCHRLRNVSVSQVGELKKLEILSLRGSCREELPKEIGNLAKLRMLDITSNRSLKRIPSNLISRLSRLEELYMQCSFKEWGSKVEGEGEETNVGFDELVGLPHLNILEVEIIDAECLPANLSFIPNWEKFHICIGGEMSPPNTKEYSRWLGLERTTNSLPSWFNIAVTQRAQKIRYTHCEDLNNILLEYDRGFLFRLESLEIFDCHQVVSLMDTTTGVLTANKPLFENLEVLRLSDLDNLKEFCVGELPQGSLGNLKRLEVVDCSNLLNPLLPSNLLQRLQNLDTLEISGVMSAEYVFRSEDFGQEPIQLRKLRHLRLWNLPQLENIWIGPVHSAIFRNLQNLHVQGCKLKYIFTSEISPSLLQLEKLSVWYCNFVEMIIGPPGEGTVVNNIILPQLTHLWLVNLPHITSFYTENNRIECPSLKVLTVVKCPQFPTSTCDFHSRNPVTIRTSLW